MGLKRRVIAARGPLSNDSRLRPDFGVEVVIAIWCLGNVMHLVANRDGMVDKNLLGIIVGI